MQVQRMMRLLDVNNKKSVSYQEFRRFACMLPPSQVSQPPPPILLLTCRLASLRSMCPPP